MSEWEQLSVDDLKERFEEDRAEFEEKKEQRDQLEVEIICLEERMTRLWTEIDKRLRAGRPPRGDGEA